MKRGKVESLSLVLLILSLTFFVAILNVPKVSAYNVVINDSFESGNLNNWFNDGGGAIISTDAHTGSYSANYDPNRGDAGSDHFGKVNIAPTFREAYLRMWVKFEGDIPTQTSDAAGAHFWRFISWPGQSGGFGPQLDMNMNSAYYLLYYMGGDVEKSYPLLFKKNVWQQHVFRLNLDTNKYQYTVDGQNMVNELGTDYNKGWNGGFDSWIFTNYDQGSGGDWKVDDVLLLTGAGASSYTENGTSQPPSDTTPPTATITAPTNNQILPAGTTSTTLSVTTNEAATCRYSISDQAYSAMTNTFTTTGGTTHTTSLTGLANGNNYTRYVRCQDPSVNAMTTSKSISFSVANSIPSDTTPPTATITSPTANQILAAGITITTLSVTTNEAATCRWSTSNQAYSAMTNNFTTTGGTSHSTSLTGLANGGSYTRYIRCQDTSGNAMTTSQSVSFSVANQASTSSNEPAGFTKFSERAFNTEPPNGAAEDGWTYEYSPASGVTIVQDSTAPKSPPNVGQALFPKGFASGSAPVDAERLMTGSTATKLYLSFWIKFSSNWYGNDGAGVNKIFFIWIHGKPAVVISAHGSANGQLYPVVATQDTPDGGVDPFQANVNSNFQVSRGQWQHWEVLLGANTAGNSDGTLKWWVDNNLIGSYTNVIFSSASDSHAWENVAWNPTYGGEGNPVPADQYQWMDHVYISTSSGSGTTQDTTPPTATITSPTANQILAAGTTITTLSATTNEAATCKYSTISGTSYSSMTNNFTTTGGTSHSTSLTGLANGGSYTRYIRCQDTSGNADTSDYVVSFSVAQTQTNQSNQTQTPLSNECSSPQPGWIWCDDFQTNKLSQYFSYDNGVGDGGNFSRASGVGLNGSTGMVAHWKPGEVSAGNLELIFGKAPSAFTPEADAGTQNYRNIYWRMYVKTQPGWTGGSGDKLSRALVFANNNWAEAAFGHVWGLNAGDTHLGIDPASGTDTTGNLKTTQYNDFNNMNWLGAVESNTPIFDSSHVGQWYCVEAHMKLNDAGQSNGVEEIWINNQLEAQHSGLNFLGNYNAYGINAVFFENYWNEGSPTTQERYFDNIVVSTQPIGCGIPLSTVNDTFPPVVTITAPTNGQAFAAGTTSTTLSLSTSEISTCRYSTTNQIYDNMQNTLTTTDGLNHVAVLSGLTNGQSYTYYTRCIDAAGNKNNASSAVSFSVNAVAPFCGDGMCNNGETSTTCLADCPLPPCTLTSASWSTNNTVQGSIVYLNVFGNNCNAKNISFEIRESDLLGSYSVNMTPKNVLFSGSSASGTWKAEWQNVGIIGQLLGIIGLAPDPNYYFTASVVGSNQSIQSSTDSASLLHVSKLALCGDSTVDSGEQCDLGSQNGIVCTPGYGSSCNYCSSTCQTVTVQGPSCGDGVCSNGETTATCLADCPSSSGAITGLNFPGSSGVSNTMSFRFTSPISYPATYIWRVYPKQQSSYYTAFFYGNSNSFEGNNDYYGFHPYPDWAHSGMHLWEIASPPGGDWTGETVINDQWYQQAAVVYKFANGSTYNIFYYNWPDTTKNITHIDTTARSPPSSPIINVADAPWNQGNEEWDGYMRGFQFYNTALTTAQIAQEIASPGSVQRPWYLNINPTPTDISDKSGNGNNPTWVGNERPALWTSNTNTSNPFCGDGICNNGETSATCVQDCPVIDNTPPIATIVSPTNNQIFPVGTTSTTLSVATNEAATCKYDTTNLGYGSMLYTLNGVNTTSHSATLTNLQNGTNYTSYTLCRDTFGNTMTTSKSVNFSVAYSPPVPPPISVCGDGVCNATETTASCATDCPVSCTLTSASWSTTEATEGETVYLDVTGNNCNMKTISFAISESNILANNQIDVTPLDVVFTGNEVKGSWIAEWKNVAVLGFLGIPQDPTYSFTASVVGTGESISSGTSDAQLLHVSKLPVCGDNITSNGEQCDLGSQNGVICTPGYGNSCNYCSSTCQTVTVQGPKCGDGVCNNGETTATCLADCPAPVDTTPPTVIIITPEVNQQFPSGTTSASLSVTTNENATCRYSSIDQAYSSMPNNFSTTGTTIHSAPLTGLTDGQNYTRYVRCQDKAGNAMTTSQSVNFGIAPSPIIICGDGICNGVETSTTCPADCLVNADTTPPAIPGKPQITLASTNTNTGAVYNAVWPLSIDQPSGQPVTEYSWSAGHDDGYGMTNGTSVTTTTTFTLPYKTDGKIDTGFFCVFAVDSAGNPSVDQACNALSIPVYNTTVTGNGTDKTPPLLSNPRPTGTLSRGTKSTIISLTTNEAATCKYSTTPGRKYSSMSGTFSTTDGFTQSANVSGLSSWFGFFTRTYNYYVRCKDGFGNVNTRDFLISFKVSR